MILVFRPYIGSDSFCDDGDTTGFEKQAILASVGSDSCTTTTNDESFFIEVFAHSALTNATLTIRGNVFDVSEFQEPGTKLISKLVYLKCNKSVDYLTLPIFRNCPCQCDR